MSKIAKNILKILILTIAILLLLVGCGETKSTKTAANNSKTQKVTSNSNSQKAEASTNKKIVYIRENNDQWMIEQQNATLKALVDSGYSDISVIKLEGSKDNAYKALESLKQSNPGVVIVSPDYFAHNIIAKGLEGTSIPVVTTAHIELIDSVDGRDTPKQNVTGLKTFSQNIELSGFKLLDIVSPINGKKVVFLNDTSSDLFPVKKVEDALRELNINLKAYVTTKTREDWRNAILKYNNDSEVGWIIVGAPPEHDASNNTIDSAGEMTWFAKNSKKPSVSFSEAASSAGILCALGTDAVKIGNQAATMATRILNGEDMKRVVAERPKSLNIVVNVKTAENLGIKFSNDILGSAFKVFTDYEGHFLPQ